MSIRVIINGYRSHSGNCTGRNDIEFISCDNDECDVFIAIDTIAGLKQSFKTKCPDGGLWLVPYEPPVECYNYFKDAYKYFDFVNTQWDDFEENPKGVVVKDRFPIMPFIDPQTHYNNVACIDDISQYKNDRVSAIISTASNLEGHILRSDFINYLNNSGYDYERFGAGVNWIPRKDDGLISYKYSIGMENSSVPYYCTEKIADCYSCLTMPIYWGCPNITEYFPEESMILVNENDFAGTLERIEDAVKSDLYSRRYDAIYFARERLYKEHMLYPYLCRLIDKYYKPTSDIKERRYPGRLSPKERKLSYKIKKALGVYALKNKLYNRKLQITTSASD